MNELPAPLIPAEILEFHIAEYVDEVMQDFTGYGFELVGRDNICDTDTLFSFTQADADIVEFGVFPIEDDEGENLDHNIRIRLPSVTTRQMATDEIDNFYLGFAVVHPTSGELNQIITAIKINVGEAVVR